MGGLREALISEIDRLRAGTSTPAESKAVAMLAKTALESIHTEIELRKFAKENPEDTQPLQLVGDKRPRESAPAIAHEPQASKAPPANKSVYRTGVARDFGDA
jgi:hypothetical protein